MTAAFPSFLGVNHPSFQLDWLLPALDRLFAAAPHIDRVFIDLWVRTVNDDQSNIQYRGHASFRGPEGQEDHPEYIDEEILDELPSVRLIERRAGDFWMTVPLSHSSGDDGDACVNGDYALVIRRGELTFTHQDYSGMEQVYEIECRHDGAAWIPKERMIVPSYDGPVTDLLADGHAAAMASYEASEFGMKELPKAIGAGLDKDGSIVFDLAPGELMRCLGDRNDR